MAGDGSTDQYQAAFVPDDIRRSIFSRKKFSFDRWPVLPASPYFEQIKGLLGHTHPREFNLMMYIHNRILYYYHTSWYENDIPYASVIFGQRLDVKMYSRLCFWLFHYLLEDWDLFFRLPAEVHKILMEDDPVLWTKGQFTVLLLHLPFTNDYIRMACSGYSQHIYHNLLFLG